jgi:hypothetical protein
VAFVFIVIEDAIEIIMRPELEYLDARVQILPLIRKNAARHS